MKLGSVELVNALSAKFEQLNVLTQTSVNINQNVVKAELGNFLLFASFLDTFYIDDGTRPSDQIVFDFLKPLLDDADITDIASKGIDRTQMWCHKLLSQHRKQTFLRLTLRRQLSFPSSLQRR